MAEDGTALDEGEQPDAMQTLAEVCAHAEVAIAYVASLTTNTTPRAAGSLQARARVEAQRKSREPSLA